MKGNTSASENNSEKLRLLILQRIFFITSRPISIKLGTNHPCLKGIQGLSYILSGHLQRGDNSKHKNGTFNNHLLKNHWTRRAHIYMQAFWHSEKS
jgi:hypothetical protein